jgi:hypothetical protein
LKFEFEFDGKIVRASAATRAEAEILARNVAKKMGLGDLVAKIAQPIAVTIDKIAGTKVKECLGCGQRQAALNTLIPDVLRPFRRDNPRAGD